jgi:hypothetical protein
LAELKIIILLTYGPAPLDNEKYLVTIYVYFRFFLHGLMKDNCDNKVKLGKQDLLVKTKYNAHSHTG